MHPEADTTPVLAAFIRRHPYALALVTVVIALLIRLSLDPWLGNDVPYAMFFAAIVVSGMYGSTRSAAAAIALSAAAVYYFLIPPRHHWGFQNISFFVGFVQYLAASAAILWLSISRANAWRETQQNLTRLHESEERQRIALGAAGMGTWFWNIKSDVVTWDRRCRELFGLAEDEHSTDSDTFLSFVHNEDRQHTRAAFRKAVAHGTDYDEILRVVCPDQSVRWLRCQGRVVEEAEEKVMIGVALDITISKQNEEIRHVNERLAGGARLGHALAHEINNPLLIVINSLYLLSLQSLGEANHNLVASSQQAADRVARITKHMLNLYPRDAAPGQVRLRELMDELVDNLQDVARQRKVTLIQRYEHDVEILAVADDLRQVCHNLLLNSIENLREGGKVVIHLSRYHDWNRGESRLRILFADNGTGIPGDVRSHLFQPFISTKPDKASGLGLWICRGILYKYGAAIRYRTSTVPGRSGTCFAISFPGASLRPQQRSAASSSAVAA